MVPTTIYADGTPPTEFTEIKLWINHPKMEVNGVERWVSPTDHNAAPFIDANSRTQVPFRAIGEGIGATVKWMSADKMPILILDARQCGCEAQNRIGRFEITEEGSDTKSWVMLFEDCDTGEKLRLTVKPDGPCPPPCPPWPTGAGIKTGFARISYNTKNVITEFEYLPDKQQCRNKAMDADSGFFNGY